MFKFRADQYLALVLVLVLLLVTVRQAQPEPVLPQAQAELVEMADLPYLVSDQPQDVFVATLSAKAVLAVDLNSASLLLEKNKDQRLALASTTKIMTALVTSDLYELGKVATVPAQLETIGHVIGFQAGEEFLIKDLLKALLINSGNDAAAVLAHHHPQGKEAFVAAMNQKAEELYLEKTSFINPSGLDAAAHYTTAFELSLMARELMKDDYLRDLVGQRQAHITSLNTQRQYYLGNTNQLLGVVPGVVGIKTGTTDLAGETLVAQVNRQGHRVLIVLLGSEDRYQDARVTIDWIFSHYQWQQISVE